MEFLFERIVKELLKVVHHTLVEGGGSAGIIL
jgi:hypothetical protein